MPILQLYTNLDDSKVPPGFVTSAATFLASLLNKPVAAIIVHVLPGQQHLHMFGSSTSPCLFGSLGSISRIVWEENKKLAGPLCQFLGKELGVDQSRILITLQDIQPTNLIVNGATRV